MTARDRGGRVVGPGAKDVLSAAGSEVPGIGRAFGRWQARLGQVPSGSKLASWQRSGMRLVCPGEPEWPTQLDDLGDARPVVPRSPGR